MPAQAPWAPGQKPGQVGKEAGRSRELGSPPADLGAQPPRREGGREGSSTNNLRVSSHSRGGRTKDMGQREEGRGRRMEEGKQREEGGERREETDRGGGGGGRKVSLCLRAQGGTPVPKLQQQRGPSLGTLTEKPENALPGAWPVPGAGLLQVGCAALWGAGRFGEQLGVQGEMV